VTTEDHRLERPGVDVSAVTEDTMVVTLSGEHDGYTTLRVLEALADAREAPNLIIDLTLCSFIDSTTLGALSSVRGGTQRIVVAVPEESYVHRVLQLFRAEQLFAIQPSLATALQSFATAPEEVRPRTRSTA
jgi:anti-anti-sigma factor